jgi:hypothetical protein
VTQEFVMHKPSLRLAAFVIALSLAAAGAQRAPAQQQRQGRSPAAGQPTAPPSGARLTVRTYEVGDMVVNVPDYAAAAAGRDASPTGAFMAGGGGGMGSGMGGMGGGFAGGGGAFPGAPAGAAMAGGGVASGDPGVTLDSLIAAMVACVAHDSWSENGGASGQVRAVGSALVVSQTDDVHEQIADFLHQRRSGSGSRRTLAVDARWLFLDSDDLDQLVGSAPDAEGAAPQLKRELLDKFTRRPTSLRAITNCFSGQRVYLISGTRRNIVSSYIPVVGSVERPDEPQLVDLAPRKARITFTQMGGGSGGSSGRSVGYQPIIEKPNFGAILEIRPTLIQGDSAAVVDLKSTLTFPAQEADPVHDAQVAAGLAPPVLAPQVDRLAVQELELATTLRVPLGQPLLAGGMTYLAPVAASVPSGPVIGDEGAPADADEQRQLYLVLEVR